MQTTALPIAAIIIVLSSTVTVPNLGATVLYSGAAPAVDTITVGEASRYLDYLAERDKQPNLPGKTILSGMVDSTAAYGRVAVKGLVSVEARLEGLSKGAAKSTTVEGVFSRGPIEFGGNAAKGPEGWGGSVFGGIRSSKFNGRVGHDFGDDSWIVQGLYRSKNCRVGAEHRSNWKHPRGAFYCEWGGETELPTTVNDLDYLSPARGS